MANVYTGIVQGASKIATGTPSAWCAAVIGGSFTRKPNNIVKNGVGGVRHVRKGTDEVTLTLECIGVAKADLAFFAPTTAGVVMVSFPSFLVEVDDGTTGKEWVLTGGQPVSLSIGCSDGPDSEVVYSFTMKFTTATEAAAGTKACVYHAASAQAGHTVNDCAVAYATAAKGTKSWTASIDLGTEMVNLQDGKTAGALTIPTAYVIKSMDYKFSSVTTEVFQGETMDGDTWTPGAITVNLKNGTAGQDVLITCSDMVPDSWDMPYESENVVGFSHEFIPGNGATYGRIAIT